LLRKALVKIILASLWIVDGRLIAIMTEMACGDQAVTPWMGDW
jgi:hypothetical protein